MEYGLKHVASISYIKSEMCMRVSIRIPWHAESLSGRLVGVECSILPVQRVEREREGENTNFDLYPWRCMILLCSIYTEAERTPSQHQSGIVRSNMIPH